MYNFYFKNTIFCAEGVTNVDFSFKKLTKTFDKKKKSWTKPERGYLFAKEKKELHIIAFNFYKLQYIRTFVPYFNFNDAENEKSN